MRIPPTENPRFPGPGSSPQGQSGPKARPKGVVDGHQANIPGPVWLGSGDDAALFGAPPAGSGGRAHARESICLDEGPGAAAEKSLPPFEAPRPVPQTDTGGWGEQTKVRERNHVKELGKKAPYLWKKGRACRGGSNQAGGSRSEWAQATV